jgi:hypothetical protein
MTRIASSCASSKSAYCSAVSTVLARNCCHDAYAHLRHILVSEGMSQKGGLESLSVKVVCHMLTRAKTKRLCQKLCDVKQSNQLQSAVSTRSNAVRARAQHKEGHTSTIWECKVHDVALQISQCGEVWGKAVENSASFCQHCAAGCRLSQCSSCVGLLRSLSWNVSELPRQHFVLSASTSTAMTLHC